MRFKKSQKTQQSTLSDGVLLAQGIRVLEPHQAVTLRSALPGVMRVVHGRVWATFDGPHSGPANNLGDRVLREGDELQFRADQRLVIEPWARFAQDLTYVNFKREQPHLTKLAT